MQRAFPGLLATPAQLRARPFKEIEATLLRDGTGHDRAVDLLAAYRHRKARAEWTALGTPTAWQLTARPSPIKNDTEARQVEAAIRAFEAGGDFEWPTHLKHLAHTTLF